MADGPFSDVLRLLRGLAGLADAGGLTDTELLECFLARRDQAAFEAPVARHGPMVLGICRNLPRDPHAAEDAFQATFLILAHKAGSIGQRDLLANWLYGVARRVAARARAATCRRHAREKQGIDPVRAEPSREALDEELRRVVHEELDRLPAKYRTPLVLCYLAGKTQAEVARQLGWTTGMVRGRLERARERLRGRLTRRGLALAGTAWAAALCRTEAAAAVPPLLLKAAVRTALPVAAGRAAVAGGTSARAVLLAQGVLKKTLLTKHGMAAALLLALSAAGAALLAHRAGAPDPPAGGPADVPVALAPQVDAKDPGWPAAKGAQEPLPQDRPAPEVRTTWQGRATLRGHANTISCQAFSPDGKFLASAGDDDGTVKLWDVPSAQQARTLKGHTGRVACVAFSADGRTLASGSDDTFIKLWDVATGKEVRTLDGHEASAVLSVAFSPDDKVLASRGG
jgi:RNA polymerase sigma factor (sigma-70 family)